MSGTAQGAVTKLQNMDKLFPGFCAGTQKPRLKDTREALWDWLAVNNNHPRRK
jgi:hypothetical protein